MWDFKVGDRVTIGAQVALRADGKPVNGTVHYIVAGQVHVLRDDGMHGAGVDETWLMAPSYHKESDLTLLAAAETAKIATQPTADEQHIAGLSPEIIDKDAFDAFMRDL